jgi:hypothetical protein
MVVASSRYYSDISLEEIKETMKLNAGSRCPGRDSNRALPEYVSKLLPLGQLVHYNATNKSGTMHMHLYSLTQ